MGRSMSVSHCGAGPGRSNSHDRTSTHPPSRGAGTRTAHRSPRASGVRGAIGRRGRGRPHRGSTRRIAFSGPTIDVISAPVTRGRSASSRTRPIRPGHGLVRAERGYLTRSQEGCVRPERHPRRATGVAGARRAPTVRVDDEYVGSDIGHQPAHIVDLIAPLAHENPERPLRCRTIVRRRPVGHLAASILGSIADDSNPSSPAVWMPSAKVSTRCGDRAAPARSAVR